MDDVLDSSVAIRRTESEGSTTSEDRESSLRVFLEKESLGHLNALFPEHVSLGYFQALTEDDLVHDYNVIDDKERELLINFLYIQIFPRKVCVLCFQIVGHLVHNCSILTISSSPQPIFPFQ